MSWTFKHPKKHPTPKYLQMFDPDSNKFLRIPRLPTGFRSEALEMEQIIFSTLHHCSQAIDMLIMALVTQLGLLAAVKRNPSFGAVKVSRCVIFGISIGISIWISEISNFSKSQASLSFMPTESSHWMWWAQWNCKHRTACSTTPGELLVKLIISHAFGAMFAMFDICLISARPAHFNPFHFTVWFPSSQVANFGCFQALRHNREGAAGPTNSNQRFQTPNRMNDKHVKSKCVCTCQPVGSLPPATMSTAEKLGIPSLKNVFVYLNHTREFVQFRSSIEHELHASQSTCTLL